MNGSAPSQPKITVHHVMHLVIWSVMKVKKLVRRFLCFCKQHRKPNTYRCYRGRLKPLRRRLGDRRIRSLTHDDIEHYLNRVNRNKAPDTVRANIGVVQSLFGFAVERGYLEKLPFAKLEKPPGRQRTRIPTDVEDVEVAMQATSAFRLIFLALRCTGARPGELAAATIADYDQEKRLIVLNSHKTEGTGRPRKIGVGVKLEALLRESVGDRSEGPLFLDERGNSWTSEKLSKNYKRCCRAAGLSEDLCLYLTRHKHATLLCEVAGIHAASLSLGHASIETTMRYVHPDDEKLAQYQDLLDPQDIGINLVGLFQRNGRYP